MLHMSFQFNCRLDSFLRAANVLISIKFYSHFNVTKKANMLDFIPIAPFNEVLLNKQVKVLQECQQISFQHQLGTRLLPKSTNFLFITSTTLIFYLNHVCFYAYSGYFAVLKAVDRFCFLIRIKKNQKIQHFLDFQHYSPP